MTLRVEAPEGTSVLVLPHNGAGLKIHDDNFGDQETYPLFVATPDGQGGLIGDVTGLLKGRGGDVRLDGTSDPQRLKPGMTVTCTYGVQIHAE